jgi:hypothetical protein
MDHSEAEHAHARAVEDKHRAEAKWLDVADIILRLEYKRERNGFGEDLKIAMGRKRG